MASPTVLNAMLTQFDAVDQSTAQALRTALTSPPPQFTWTETDLYEGDPCGADINQDGVGDCYLMATMGAIAHANPQAIRDRINYHPATGEFDVTLWDGRQWRHIAVTQADIDANIAGRGGSGGLYVSPKKNGGGTGGGMGLMTPTTVTGRYWLYCEA